MTSSVVAFFSWPLLSVLYAHQNRKPEYFAATAQSALYCSRHRKG